MPRSSDPKELEFFTNNIDNTDDRISDYIWQVL